MAFVSATGVALASPSSQNFSLDARPDGESKVAALVSQERSPVKLDFIPLEERASRARRGYPTVTVPQDGYGVEGHGTPSSVLCRTGEPMNAKELAKWIGGDSRYQAGMTVYLMCCETGKGDRSIAQKLADTLGTEVVAPTEKLWPLKNGLYVVAQERMRKTLGVFETGEQRADITRLGTMKTFRPAPGSTPMVAVSRDNAAATLSSSNAASADRPQQTPRKPLLRASARTAALLAGFHGQRDSTLYLNSRER
jgi:hypothetical protein